MKAILHQRENMPHLQGLWQHLLRGDRFVSKKVYLILRTTGMPTVSWNQLLYGHVARPKAIMNMWQACHGRLLTKARLHIIGMLNNVNVVFVQMMKPSITFSLAV
ncbi:unnamed protein product [Lathyrus sativus]|nr:unnamed protein product [Lathyrus sativus]